MRVEAEFTIKKEVYTEQTIKKLETMLNNDLSDCKNTVEEAIAVIKYFNNKRPIETVEIAKREMTMVCEELGLSEAGKSPNTMLKALRREIIDLREDIKRARDDWDKPLPVPVCEKETKS